MCDLEGWVHGQTLGEICPTTIENEIGEVSGYKARSTSGRPKTRKKTRTLDFLLQILDCPWVGKVQ